MKISEKQFKQIGGEAWVFNYINADITVAIAFPPTEKIRSISCRGTVRNTPAIVVITNDVFRLVIGVIPFFHFAGLPCSIA